MRFLVVLNLRWTMAYCAFIVRLLCVNSASIVRNILDIDGVLNG